MFHSDREKYYKKPLTDCLWLTALPTCGLVLYSSTIRTTVLGVKEWRWTIKHHRNSPDSPHTGGTLPCRLEKQKEEGVCRFSFRKFGGQLLCVTAHNNGDGCMPPKENSIAKRTPFLWANYQSGLANFPCHYCCAKGKNTTEKLHRKEQLSYSTMIAIGSLENSLMIWKMEQKAKKKCISLTLFITGFKIEIWD